MSDRGPTLITTSWDDGHPLDLRIASLLARHGLRGTFYLPLRAVADRLLSPVEIRELHAMGMEIGSHTVTHPVLTRLPRRELDRELRDSRRILEDLLGTPVTSFCYPGGKFNRTVARRAALAGYHVCRTTIGFQTSARFDPVRMPVSMQLFPHTASTHYRHALRYGNWRGVWKWRRSLAGETDTERLASAIASEVAARGGVFHLWGHSWEIERFALWNKLERIAASLSSLEKAVAVTNRQVGKAIGGGVAAAAGNA